MSLSHLSDLLNLIKQVNEASQKTNQMAAQYGTPTLKHTSRTPHTRSKRALGLLWHFFGG
jgi:hypothetical protein